MDELNIILKNDNKSERTTRDRLTSLLKKYDVSAYIYTKDILIEGMAIPHSHPILTLSTFPYSDENIVLDAFIHEQLHWYLDSVADKLKSAVMELQVKYPDAPSDHPFGCRDQNSTYEHLMLCSLAYSAMKQLVGDEQARLVLHFLQNHHYMWVYRTIEDDKEYIESVIKKYGLKPVAFAFK